MCFRYRNIYIYIFIIHSKVNLKKYKHRSDCTCTSVFAFLCQQKNLGKLFESVSLKNINQEISMENLNLQSRFRVANESCYTHPNHPSVSEGPMVLEETQQKTCLEDHPP